MDMYATDSRKAVSDGAGSASPLPRCERRLRCAGTAALFVLSALLLLPFQNAQAQAPQTVPANWSLIPTGIGSDTSDFLGSVRCDAVGEAG